jgi:hypothetical protein
LLQAAFAAGTERSQHHSNDRICEIENHAYDGNPVASGGPARASQAETSVRSASPQSLSRP